MRRPLTEEERKAVEFKFKFLAGQELSGGDLVKLVSIEDQYQRDGKLSEPQLDLIQKIWERY